MSAQRRRLKETKTPYREERKTAPPESRAVEIKLRWSEVERSTEPIILNRNGEPAAVVIRYEDFRRLEQARAERREAAWQELEALLSQVHARTAHIPPEEIEADITAAREEVREQHRASRRHD